jgi:hypothetical protein
MMRPRTLVVFVAMAWWSVVAVSPSCAEASAGVQSQSGSVDGLTGPATVALVIVTALGSVATFVITRRERRLRARPRIGLAAYEAAVDGKPVYLAISNMGGPAVAMDVDLTFVFADGQGNAPAISIRGGSLNSGERLWFAVPASGYGDRPMSLPELQVIFTELHAHAVYGDAQTGRHHFDQRLAVMSLRCSSIADAPREVAA